MKPDQINHYHPVLRWKHSEKGALSKLSNAEGEHITPIIELVPKSFGKIPVERASEKAMKELASHWRRFALIDLNLLGDILAGLALPHIARHADYYQCDIGIVAKLDCDYLNSLGKYFGPKRICLRLSLDQVVRNDLKSNVEGFLRLIQRKPQHIDLMVDIGELQHEGFCVAKIMENVPFRDDWMTITIVAGAFPQDLSELTKNSQHQIRRLDWLAWLEYVNQDTKRPAFYGDYGVSSGKFKDEEGNKRNFSASLRYTSKDYWVVMRGEGVKNADGPGFHQYPAQAMLLCEREEFSGPNYSVGDRYIYEMAQQVNDTGNVNTWLEAAINHHLTFVPRQIASTFGG